MLDSLNVSHSIFYVLFYHGCEKAAIQVSKVLLQNDHAIKLNPKYSRMQGMDHNRNGQFMFITRF